MDSIVDTPVALAPATARFDRQRANARQQRWMTELEQIMLAQQMQQRPTAAVHSAGPEPEPEPVRIGSSTALAQGTAPVAGRFDAPGFDAPQRIAGSATGGTAAQPAAKAGNAPVSGATEGVVEQAGSGTAQPGTRSGAATCTGPAVAGAAPAGLVQAAAAPTSISSPLPGGDAEAPGVTSISRTAIPIASAAGVVASAFVSSPAIAMVAAVAPQQLAGIMPAPTGLWPVVIAGESAFGVAQENAAPSDEYARQLLHLFHGEDGVQAFIRDAELKGAQLRMVAQALALELGGSGQRLAGLTVNGRRVPLALAGSDEEPQATRNDAASPPITEKGNI